MANLQSAIKKIRKDKKRTRLNNFYRDKLNRGIKMFNKEEDSKKKEELLKKVVSDVDKTAKKHIIHKNKANRLKSRLHLSLNKVITK